MAHDHHHGHDHGTIRHLNTAFITGIIFNFLFVVIEVVVGLRIHSLSLLSDAGHNLADVASLALAMLALRLATVKPSGPYTYGYSKTSILVALLNAVILFVSIGAITYEAIVRLVHPEPLPGVTIAVVAGIGIFINTGTALLFMKQKDNDLNVKAAYLHLASDALVSFALVLGGIAIYFTGIFRIDAILSLLVAVVIIVSTWHLLRDSFRLSLDAVPPGIDLEKIRELLRSTPGVKDIHHVHIWALSTTVTAMTTHLVLEDSISIAEEALLKKKIKHDLGHHNIQHATLETERAGQACDREHCEEC